MVTSYWSIKFSPPKVQGHTWHLLVGGQIINTVSYSGTFSYGARFCIFHKCILQTKFEWPNFCVNLDLTIRAWWQSSEDWIRAACTLPNLCVAYPDSGSVVWLKQAKRFKSSPCCVHGVWSCAWYTKLKHDSWGFWPDIQKFHAIRYRVPKILNHAR